MGKRILVTGAAGFIGFHTAKRLYERGDQVVGFDNFNDYYTPELKRMRACQLAFPVLEGDICDKEILFSIAEEFRPSHILHLAAQAGVRASLTDPDMYIQSNVVGFLNILEVCRELEIPLVYASSSSVYGNNTKLPFSIADSTDRPANLYGATKKAKEMMAYSYHSCYEIPVTGLRYFTVYGPWGRPDMAYFLFAEAIERGEPISLYRGMRRDFTYIDDIVDGTVAAIDREAKCDIFNLGNSTPLPVTDLIASLETHLGKRAIIEERDAPVGEIPETFADISCAQKELNFSPSTPLDDGMRSFVDWFKECRVE